MQRTATRYRLVCTLFCLLLAVATTGLAETTAPATTTDTAIMDIARGILGEATAEDAPVEEAANTFRFSVSPVLPDNQVDEGVGYFYLKMDPAQRQTIEVSVRNDGTEPISIAITPTVAVTNANGIMQYGKSDAPPDPSLPYLMTDLMELENDRLSLEAGETRTVPVVIQMPEESFDGTLLGGLVFLREQAQTEQSAEGTMISNLFSYVMPIRLVETDMPIKAAFELADVAANTETAFGPKTILTVRNTQPVIVKPMTLTYALYASDDLDTPIMEHTNEQIEMAPNTAMPYTVRQDNALEPGDYVAHVVLTYEGETSTFEKAFTLAEP